MVVFHEYCFWWWRISSEICSDSFLMALNLLPKGNEILPPCLKWNPVLHIKHTCWLYCIYAEVRIWEHTSALGRRLARTLAMGQGLAGLICGTAVTSQYLATNFQVNTPMLQSFLSYTLLCVTYSSLLLCRRGTPTVINLLSTSVQQDSQKT